MNPKIYKVDGLTDMFYAVFPDGVIFYNQIDKWQLSQLSKDSNSASWIARNPEYNPVFFRDIKAVLTPNHSLKALKQLHAEYVGTQSAIGSATHV